MRALPKIFDDLVEGLTFLPGIGPRSAQRMALYLLKEDNRDKAKDMVQVIQKATETIKHCQNCRNYTDQQYCLICLDETRESNQLCIVETPADLVAIESGTEFNGYYFVLMGKLSPLDGIGTQHIGIDRLMQYIENNCPKEVILALSSTVEGEATGYYISEALSKYSCRISRIAKGIPTGGNIEYLDTRTLIDAFDNRKLALSE